MPRSRWPPLLALVIVVVVWILAFRDGLDFLSVLAAVLSTAGAVLLGLDGLRDGRRPPDDPPPPDPPRRGPTRV